MLYLLLGQNLTFPVFSAIHMMQQSLHLVGGLCWVLDSLSLALSYSLERAIAMIYQFLLLNINALLSCMSHVVASQMYPC